MLARERIEARMRGFPERCKSAGLKVTHQRSAIFGVLAATESHPTPEEVYAAVRHELPSISLATVYKVLDLFQRHRFVRRVSTEQQVARFDANMDEHQHLVCHRCGRIQDVELSLSETLTPPDGADFAVSHCDVIFHGMCGECRRA